MVNMIKSKSFVPFLFLLSVINVIPLFAQKQGEATNNETKKLPSKDATIPLQEKNLKSSIKEYNEAFYVLNRLNNSQGSQRNTTNLQTPQGAMEHFIINCRNGEFGAASEALNLNLMPDGITRAQAATLAQKLYFVLDQRINIEWSGLSDRPDGQTDFSTSTNKAIAGKARRSIIFGEIDLDGRDVVLRLQRVKYGDYSPFWVIAANAVENIDPLYAVYGPRKLDRMMPDWARLQLWGIPIWKYTGMILLIIISYFVGRFSIYLLRTAFRKSGHSWMHTMAKRLAKPAGFAMAVLFFYILLNELISFGGPFARTLYAVLLIVVISAITWFIMRFIDSFMVYVAENKIGDTNPEENREARMKLTYISVARRVVTFIVIIVAASIILSQFRSLEKLGISLLASAGLATIILGVAAQSTLGNIIAGIQIAVTRPARIGDAVTIDGEWGYVEDIRFTYMVVRTWDMRRLVIPLKRIISVTFENWSMTNAHQIRPIILYADYRIDVPKVRAKFEELLKDSEKWDQEKDPILQVVDMTEKAIKLRALCSARNASSSWDLHCELREALVSYISDLEDGQHLTKTRLLSQNSSEQSSELS